MREVARTERNIINWCRANKDGISRLDCYFDPNERKYFITPQSVELAIKEEQAKAARSSEITEPFGNVRNDAESFRNVPKSAEDRPAERLSEPTRAGDTVHIKTLEQEVLDLKITNKAKDYFIEQLKGERQSLVQEQRGYVERLLSFSRQIGELKTKLFQLGAGKGEVENESDHAFIDPQRGSTTLSE